MKLTSKNIVVIALLIALSVVLSVVDSFIPSFIPGMKLGLANIIILYSLMNLGFSITLYINILRIFLASLLRGNLFTMGFFMSFVGGLLSLLMMFIFLKYVKKLHLVTISVIGSMFHVIGQIIVGIIYLNTINLIYYLPIQLVISILTGIFTGFVTLYLNKLKLLDKYK